MIPIAELTIIKRQDAGLIIENCHRIKDGENIRLAQFGDFVFYHRGTVAAIQETIVKLMKRNLHGVINLQYTDINYTDIKGIQVISPLREKTELSCKALNNKLRAVLNDNNPDIDGCKFKQDDKVIQTENNYTLNIMNGDIGYVDHVDTSTKTTFVEFEAPVRMVEIPIQDNKLELAYSITCHKFQGSESPVIIIPIHHSLGSMVVQRNWLYTAISRTKKLCILVGEYEEIPKIISRNNQQKRFTGLQSFIKTEQEEVSNGTI
jgi:exodeoxyribonuclease V alpha subunit